MVLSSSIILTERRAKANFRNFMTPTGGLVFILGAYITCMIILFTQLIILLAGAIYLTKINLIPVLAQVSATLFLACSVFVLLGMLVGYLFKSDETTTLASISIASILIFFSNAIIPSESIGGLFRYVALYNPLLITDSLLKRVILFNEGWSSLYSDFIILGIILITLLILNLIARKLTRRLI